MIVFLFPWVALACLAANATEPSHLEAAAHGFPALLDLEGRKLADGDFSQWIEKDQLHVRITYEFPARRKITEHDVFRQQPQLIQDRWSWIEMRSGEVYRRFEVDFTAGTAHAEKHEDHELKQWSAKPEITPGRTFAGFGFTLAIKNRRESLLAGQISKLQAVAFTPKPRVVTVEISYGGLDRMLMAGRTLEGERFIIHPDIPKIAKLFVHASDTKIWLTHPPPAEFLRWEGSLVEPSDPMVRVDLLPGGRSGPAAP